MKAIFHVFSTFVLVAAILTVLRCGDDDISSPGDTTPPEVVTDLRIVDTTEAALILNWTAPGDDAGKGTATQYDIRSSLSLLTEENWPSAITIPSTPTPRVAGTGESLTLSKLSAGTTYYYALKSADEVPNWSPISNVVSLTTPPTSPDSKIIGLWSSEPDPGAITYWELTQDGTLFIMETRDGVYCVADKGTYVVRGDSILVQIDNARSGSWSVYNDILLLLLGDPSDTLTFNRAEIGPNHLSIDDCSWQGTITADIDYVGFGTVDDTHKVYVALWYEFYVGVPDLVSALTTPRGTTVFTITDKICYVATFFDNDGSGSSMPTPGDVGEVYHNFGFNGPGSIIELTDFRRSAEIRIIFDDSHVYFAEDPDERIFRSKLVDDTNLREAFPNESWGDLPYVHYAGDPGGVGCNRNGLYRFRLPVEAETLDINRAELLIYVYGRSIEQGEAYRISAHHVYSFPAYTAGGIRWAEDNVTWNTRPRYSHQYNPVPESSWDYYYGHRYDFWMRFDVTDIVRQEYLEGDDYISFYLVTENLSGGCWEDFIKTRSKESVHLEERPVLLITAATR